MRVFESTLTWHLTVALCFKSLAVLLKSEWNKRNILYLHKQMQRRPTKANMITPTIVITTKYGIGIPESRSVTEEKSNYSNLFTNITFIRCMKYNKVNFFNFISRLNRQFFFLKYVYILSFHKLMEIGIV